MKNEDIRKKLNELSDAPTSDWKEETLEREAKKGWMLKSSYIALQVLDALKEKKISKTELAERMNVSRQWVNEIVKGRENMTLQVIDKLEQALEIEIEINERKKTVDQANWHQAEVATGIEQANVQGYLTDVNSAGSASRIIMVQTYASLKGTMTYAQGSYVMQTGLKKLQESYDIE